MTAAEILNKAADLIETKGWTQGAYARNDEGDDAWIHGDYAVCYCCVGAVLASSGQGKEHDPLAAEKALDALVSLLRTESIPHWNDAPGRTKEEVVAALRAAAKEAA